MKRGMIGIVLAMFVVMLGAPRAVNAQNIPPQGEQRLDHKSSGIFSAPAYAYWRTQVISGNSATGSGQSIVVFASPLILADGYTPPAASLFNTNVPVTVGAGSVQETVTPSSVSIAACPVGTAGLSGNSQCATITGTFNNVHGYPEPVVSGDAGIMEAITDAATQGGGLVWWEVDTGNVTLSTTGLTTTSTTKVPTNFESIGASAYVETTITTSTNWAVGISGSTSAFCTANSTLTAGTTCIANLNSPARVGSTNALTAVLYTVTGANAGAGVVKARVWGYTPVQSSN